MSLNSVTFTPFSEEMTNKFWSVISPDADWFATMGYDPFQDPDNSPCRQGRIHFNSQRFPVKIVYDVQYPELSTVHKGITHEVDAPHFIWRFRDEQGFPDPRGNRFLALLRILSLISV